MANRVDNLDAFCRVKSAQAILGLWLEVPGTNRGRTCDLIGGLLSILDGVPEAIERSEDELAELLEVISTSKGGTHHV
ncbi:hypothetical protein AABD61_02220 [Edwardsiella piscicida]|uniref:hypothetical protein n=1 Tax=Edwardsiella piscicida TaxID=1263550 RepID=UPI00370D6CBE